MVLLGRMEIRDNRENLGKKDLLGPKVGKVPKDHQDLLELKERGVRLDFREGQGVMDCRDSGDSQDHQVQWDLQERMETKVTLDLRERKASRVQGEKRDLPALQDLKVLEGSLVLLDLPERRVLLERLGDKERKERMALQEWRALRDQLARREYRDLLE